MSWFQYIWNLQSLKSRPVNLRNCKLLQNVVQGTCCFCPVSELRVSHVLSERDKLYRHWLLTCQAVGQTATKERWYIYTAEAHLNWTGDTTATRQQSGSAVFRSGGPVRHNFSLKIPHRTVIFDEEQKKYVHKNRFILSYFLHKSCIWNILFLLFFHWVAIKSIRWDTCAHASVFYEPHGDSGNIKQRKDVSVLKNRNAKQSFTESGYKSSHNQNHTHSISPLLLWWRLPANW